MKTGRLSLLLLPVVPLAASGAEPAAAPPGATSPAGWDFVGETGFRLYHDSNVYLQDGGALAAGATVRGEPARADTLVGTLSAGAGLVSPKGPAGRLTLDYHVDLVRFDDFADESHDDHRLRAALAGADGAWSWDANAGVLITDGSDRGPVYRGLGGGPAIGGEPVRARRDQTVSKGAFRVTRAWEGGWARVLGAASYQDFHTDFDSAAGISPYVDRGEGTVGFEAGRDVRPGLALVAGVRGGAQVQKDRPPTDHLNSSSSILRVLVGVEGKPARTLKLDVRVGPDFRHFGDDLPASLERDTTTPYAEASATWTPTSADTVTFAGKYNLWLSSAGRGAYEDALWELAWKHRLNERISTRVGGRVATGDSRGYAYPGVKSFRDVIYGATVGADYRLAKNTTLDASVTCDQGDSGLPDRPGREYTRVQAGLGVARTW